jgi:hypothetical protein
MVKQIEPGVLADASSSASRPGAAGGLQGISTRWRVVIGAGVLLAFAIKILISLKTFGTNDAYFWCGFLSYLQANGPIALYRDADLFIHPPFMIHVLRCWGWLESTTGVPLQFWLRLTAILADVASLLLTFKLLQRLNKATPSALLLLALAPASVMISGFHGNTDPVMICFVLLAVYLIEAGQSPWLAGFACGMSLNIKAAAVIFPLCFIMYLPDFKKRLQFAGGAILTVLIGSMPYIAQDPVLIVSRMGAYRSIYGHWGLSRFIGMMRTSLPLINMAFKTGGRFFVLAAILAAAFWMNRQRCKPPLFLQCGVVAFLFLTLTPGFGVQYLSWLVPFAAIELGTAALFYSTSAVFLFVIYNFWAGGYPWYFADSTSKGPWSKTPMGLETEIICWFSVLMVCLIYFHRVRSVCVQDTSAQIASA